jgi:hypothetical protein
VRTRPVERCEFTGTVIYPSRQAVMDAVAGMQRRFSTPENPYAGPTEPSYCERGDHWHTIRAKSKCRETNRTIFDSPTDAAHALARIQQVSQRPNKPTRFEECEHGNHWHLRK